MESLCFLSKFRSGYLVFLIALPDSIDFSKTHIAGDAASQPVSTIDAGGYDLSVSQPDIRAALVSNFE
ncbi:MAG: hypothetical protein J0665_04765 [Deltaproteobacteria bacterium]|nr:hypothetical protein [Deltaproteobacteria bacterium]